MDKRKFSRIDYNIKAVIHSIGNEYNGKVTNLSINGVGIETKYADHIEPKAEVDLSLLITSDGMELDLDIRSTVVRVEPDYVGVRFNSVDLDTFMHIRNIMALNRGDYDLVMDEFLSNVRKLEI